MSFWWECSKAQGDGIEVQTEYGVAVSILHIAARCLLRLS